MTKMQQTVAWCRSYTEGYEGVDIKNLTSSWADGKALCALIHHFRPDAINYEECLKMEPLQRLTCAIEASRKLGCPDLIDPEDFLPNGPDSKCFCTFLWTFQPILNPNPSADIEITRLAQSVLEKPKQNTQTYQSYSSLNSAPPRPKTLESRNENITKISSPLSGASKKCVKCNKDIFAGAVEAEGKLYHSNCFVCKCGEKLKSGEFVSLEGEILCKVCAHRKFMENKLKKEREEKQKGETQNNKNEVKTETKPSPVASPSASSPKPVTSSPKPAAASPIIPAWKQKAEEARKLREAREAEEKKAREERMAKAKEAAEQKKKEEEERKKKLEEEKMKQSAKPIEKKEEVKPIEKPIEKKEEVKVEKKEEVKPIEKKEEKKEEVKVEEKKLTWREIEALQKEAEKKKREEEMRIKMEKMKASAMRNNANNAQLQQMEKEIDKQVVNKEQIVVDKFEEKVISKPVEKAEKPVEKKEEKVEKKEEKKPIEKKEEKKILGEMKSVQNEKRDLSSMFRSELSKRNVSKDLTENTMTESVMKGEKGVITVYDDEDDEQEEEDDGVFVKSAPVDIPKPILGMWQFYVGVFGALAAFALAIYFMFIK